MSTVTEMSPGQIATPEGSEKLKGELLSAHTVRCGDDWMAIAAVYSDGAAEITVSAKYNPDIGKWSTHEYYYSFEKTTQALIILEQSGKLPVEEEL
ncbi:MAG: hypothetical protein GFH27_549379n47 [Chloroflexi bacterium AL-W]|nr:hypothetical protein [Chloroflexi bacterium AL-N1]NOK71171.1 hypothetical protein [Chloroflexi bacterium AL-N10]NOK78637.1 hypothetical protein [Chloroflexi bacterium AL-N5]NOK85933.1 hypothetical protein [Chloroflexi bacterium AL-W]NOK92908.1 hypothetical protein [Chloroflexi bacterium AL-N15]